MMAKTNLIKILILVFLYVITGCGTGSRLPKEIKMEYIKKSFTYGNATLPYNIMYPESTKGKVPLIVFLHGSGERGVDNEKQLVHGSTWIKSNLKQYPAVVIFPQCPTDGFWSSVERTALANGDRVYNFEKENAITESLLGVEKLIESYKKEPYIDVNRIYIIGLSMGGMGVFELLWRQPGNYAAAVPICGGVNLNKTKELLATKNIWVFHGEKDAVVLPDFSRKIVDLLRAKGHAIKYTEYKGVTHSSWNNVFEEPNVFEWMFSKKLDK